MRFPRSDHYRINRRILSMSQNDNKLQMALKDESVLSFQRSFWEEWVTVLDLWPTSRHQFLLKIFLKYFFLFEVKHAKTELKPEVTFYEFVCSGFSIVWDE